MLIHEFFLSFSKSFALLPMVVVEFVYLKGILRFLEMARLGCFGLTNANNIIMYDSISIQV